ncbi:ATP-dependent dethiobiotin synthetase BioD [Nocardiopsis terrae]|uniref:ATP-dependent dethiobiotin synthetase BioD n=1 Tax=Nocardiopsis terrae TaxID=372655 RepID=A0ABR9HKE6_9ACTN|nr:dethiobiotin synthase [Nocardiopsis terrae]MBE1459446.1 dethiobiotin synthetase [Nocardiopsis terrae]GHC95575.1 ATP-dependent dethiobiotin synthetase BioD [Nocardiopsis terrae]
MTRVLVVTGTGTEVGKTVATAAVAALAAAQGRRVAVLKAAQTGVGPGEEGDAQTVARLVPGVTTAETARYPEPLAPARAAARVGLDGPEAREVADLARDLAGEHDLVLVEGAGGLLVRLNAAGETLADAAVLLAAPVLVVADPRLGTLNATALTAEALRSRGLDPAGVLVGSWPGAPEQPDLAMRCNLTDLPGMGAGPLVGVLPEGMGALPPAGFTAAARQGLGAVFGGTWPGPGREAV